MPNGIEIFPDDRSEFLAFLKWSRKQYGVMPSAAFSIFTFKTNPIYQWWVAAGRPTEKYAKSALAPQFGQVTAEQYFEKVTD